MEETEDGCRRKVTDRIDQKAAYLSLPTRVTGLGNLFPLERQTNLIVTDKLDHGPRVARSWDRSTGRAV